MKKIALFVCMAFSFAGQSLWADQGTTSAAFLKLATGPRAIAMGESFAGLADDVNALYYNPSGLAFMKDKEVTLMHAVWFQDIFFDNFGAAMPIEGIGSIGLHMVYLNAGTFEKWIYDANGLPTQQGSFTASDMAAGLSFSKAFFTDISAGLLVKYISENIDSNGASGVAVDVSGFWRNLFFPGLGLGLNVQNVGPAMGFNNTYSLPLNFRLGLGYKPMKNVSVDMDYTQPIETAGVLGIGGEYGYRDFLYLRGGYQYQGAIDYNQTEVGYGPSVASGLSLGLGFKYLETYFIDYAYVPFGFLGNTHRISITLKFK